jgi:hypothetical protein
LATAEVAIELKEHPIMLTLQDSISGNGFLMRFEDGAWWMYGVRPAAMAASGENIDEAFLNFRASYKQILMDIAQESPSFEEFEAEVKKFFEQKDADNEDAQLWEAALTAIRGVGGCDPPAPFSKLVRQSPEKTPSFIKVERVDAESKDLRLTPSENVQDVYAYSFPKAA